MTKFFAAANTEKGFQSQFFDCFSPEAHKRIYILKGGPGTGKSTLMRQIAFAAQANGYEVECYYCSSDTRSLDGVRIPMLGTAILDGTAPHTADPLYPGAVEQLIDLGAAFDRGALERKRREIVALSHEKTEAYRAAYRYLAAAGGIVKERDALLTPIFLSEKARRLSQRLVGGLKHAEKGGETRRYVSAIGIDGYVTLDTLHRKAERVCAIVLKNGLEFLFMDTLYTALSKEGFSMTVTPSPLFGDHIESIFVEGERVLFAVMREDEAQSADKIINSARFVLREHLAERRARLRFSEKCIRMLLDGAYASFADAGRSHAALEEIYGNFTDFSVIDRIKNRLIAEIFANKV